MADAEVVIDQTELQRVVMGESTTFAVGLRRRIFTTAGELAPQRSGRLKRAISEDPVTSRGPWEIETGVSVKVRHAAPVHNGARPHVIRARNAPVLAFYWPKVGRDVFFRSVNHPGNRAQPFLSNAAHRVKSADPRIT